MSNTKSIEDRKKIMIPIFQEILEKCKINELEQITDLVTNEYLYYLLSLYLQLMLLNPEMCDNDYSANGLLITIKKDIINNLDDDFDTLYTINIKHENDKEYSFFNDLYDSYFIRRNMLLYTKINDGKLATIIGKIILYSILYKIEL